LASRWKVNTDRHFIYYFNNSFYFHTTAIHFHSLLMHILKLLLFQYTAVAFYARDAFPKTSHNSRKYFKHITRFLPIFFWDSHFFRNLRIKWNFINMWISHCFKFA
jgi:hypothetical protein